jgi:hypothetical protein
MCPLRGAAADAGTSSSTTRSKEPISAGRHCAMRQVGMIQHGTAEAQSFMAEVRSSR